MSSLPSALSILFLKDRQHAIICRIAFACSVHPCLCKVSALWLRRIAVRIAA